MPIGDREVQNPDEAKPRDVLHELQLVMVQRTLWVIVVLAGIVQLLIGIEEVLRGRYALVVAYAAPYLLVIAAAPLMLTNSYPIRCADDGSSCTDNIAMLRYFLATTPLDALNAAS